MHEFDAQQTAFSIPHGHYQFNRMAFGLKNAAAILKTLESGSGIILGIQRNDMFVYFDDIVIYTSFLTPDKIQ